MEAFPLLLVAPAVSLQLKWPSGPISYVYSPYNVEEGLEKMATNQFTGEVSKHVVDGQFMTVFITAPSTHWPRLLSLKLLKHPRLASSTVRVLWGFGPARTSKGRESMRRRASTRWIFSVLHQHMDVSILPYVPEGNGPLSYVFLFLLLLLRDLWPPPPLILSSQAF